MKRSRTVFGLLMCVALVASACGGDDGESGGGEARLDASVKEGVASQIGETTATSAAAAEISSMEEYEAFWAEQRQVIVDKIKTNGWGVDEATNTLNGPEGFTIDLSACPSNWSNTQGLTDTEIKVGQSTAFSGTLADYGNMSRAMQVYLDYVNENGGVTDSEGKTRTFNLIAKDDGYDPARGIPNVDELLDRDQTFMIHNGGSAIVMRTYDKINERCVPHPLAWTGHPAWGDPVNHPWTTGALLSYFTEAILWGSYIEEHLPPGAKVAGLAMNNDFGAAYIAGFESFLAQSDHDIEFVYETIEPTAPDVKNEMTTLAAEDPDVFIAMTTGVTCTLAIQEAAQNGLNESAELLWQPSVCKALSFVGEDVVGDSSDGWMIAGGGYIDINDSGFADHVAIKWARGLLEDAGIDPGSSGNLSAGFHFGWPLVEAFRIAGQLDGGLTRTNFILAWRAMDLESPFMLPGVRLTLNGNKDAYLVEGTEFARFDSAQQSWVQEGATIDLSGESAPCAWDQAIANCQ
ncbi:MAG: ABC transporter substrate-binding protein [Acidimicrobiia bacterium]|nr:ABC transporter substrate-binding protein [Acidimicrobiia bacterium]